MYTINPSQNKRLWQLLNECGITEAQRYDLVASFTDGRTKSTKELTEFEANQIIAWLETEKDKLRGNQVMMNRDRSESGQKMRRKIISCCHTLGWYLRDKNEKLILKDSKPQLDWAHIESFCTEKGPYKKKLNDHHLGELPTLVSVFEKMAKEAIQKAA